MLFHRTGVGFTMELQAIFPITLFSFVMLVIIKEHGPALSGFPGSNCCFCPLALEFHLKVCEAEVTSVVA